VSPPRTSAAASHAALAILAVLVVASSPVLPEEQGPDSAVESQPPPASRFFFDPRAAGGRLVIAVVVGVLATLLTPDTIAWHVRAMVGWDASALLFALLAWIMIARASPAETRLRAALEDPGRRVVFVIAIAASVFSLFAAVRVLKQVRTLPPGQAEVWTALALAAVVLSWVVTHTAFTLRYAHLYYRRRGPSECLRFEGTDAPSDLDFAYFAFTIGMCFQVSDVVIASARVRRAVLLHSLVSFAYNTTILALALNLVTTLLG
jgi:uncharacterized membrane protein